MAAIFLPSLVLGWLALRTAGEQRVLIERQSAELHQAETDALAAEIRGLIEEKQHAFDEIVRALVSGRDASALAEDYGNQLAGLWREGGIPFAISPTGGLAFPTPAHARQNRTFEEFLWYNSAFLSNETVAEIYQVQQAAQLKASSPREAEFEKVISEAESGTAYLAGPASKGDPSYQKEKYSTRSIVPLRSASDTQAVPSSKVAPELSDFQTAVGGAANGVLSRFVQNDLQILFWTRPDPNENWLFGLMLGPAELNNLAKDLLLDERRDGTMLAILNDKAKPVSKSSSGFVVKWKRPFVATEIGELLPHWEVALYLANPGQFTESARLVTITLVLLITLALAAILAGGYLVALDTRRQLALAQKKTDFVSNVSHELKTPLTSIRMFAELLAEERVKEPEKRNRYLRIIASESDRLARLVNNVLDFARIERRRKSYDMRPADAYPVIERIWEAESDRLREAGFVVDWSADRGPYPVTCDADALAQILVNLISNSEKYSPERKEITLRSRIQGEMLVVSVLDRGAGVQKRMEKKIFEAFFRGSDSLSSGVQGSGLGLTLARRMARDQGGDVTYQPREGGGSVFSLSIPMQQGSAA
ncbi:MAG TPA: HAMP domain-containing sensor histidine kinase [Terrimicrobiaceae bacterium]